MPKFYFTFGYNHHDTHGRSLGRYYTIIEAEDMQAAREKYVAKYGNLWSMTYNEEQFKGQIEAYDLMPAAFEHLELCSAMPQGDAARLFGHDSHNNRYPHNQSEAVRLIEKLQLEFDL